MTKHKMLVWMGCVFLLTGSFLSACSSQPGLEDLEEWDLVWISDSSGWGVAEVFADMVEEDTGIPVIVHDSWVGGLSAGEILRALKGENPSNYDLAKAPELIKEAEIVVIYGNPEESVDENNPGDWHCTGGKNYVNACGADTFSRYIDHLEEIYSIIFDLREGKPTIIRAYDAYVPVIVEWEKDGVFDACQACWGNYNAAIHQAAATYNIPVGAVAEAWNGPNRDEDPNDKGYTWDGIHPNEKGAVVIANALRELGYEPVVP